MVKGIHALTYHPDPLKHEYYGKTNLPQSGLRYVNPQHLPGPQRKEELGAMTFQREVRKKCTPTVEQDPTTLVKPGDPAYYRDPRDKCTRNFCTEFPLLHGGCPASPRRMSYMKTPR